MSDQLCACETGLGNTGLPNCENIMKALRKFAFQQSQTSAGVLNYINPATVLNKAWMDALLNNANKTIRLFPSPELKNISSAKDGPIKEKFDDNSTNIIGENIRTMMGILADAPPRFKANFETIHCNKNTSFYGIDKLGNIIGIKKGSDGFLYPIPINVKSVHAAYKFGDDKDSSQIALEFEIPAWVNDADFRMISAAKFPDFNPLSITGLLDADVAFSNIAAGAVTATITVANNTLDNPTEVEGMLSANFVSSTSGVASKIRDTTTGADIAVVSAVESAPGVYDLTYALVAGKTVVVYGSLPGVDFALLKTRSYVSI